jgi:hypothetical protein
LSVPAVSVTSTPAYRQQTCRFQWGYIYAWGSKQAVQRPYTGACCQCHKHTSLQAADMQGPVECMEHLEAASTGSTEAVK